MRGKMALPVLALLCLLTGCTAWTGDSYVSVTPHAEGYAQTEPGDVAEAASQEELTEVLARLVKNHTDQATVDVSQYDGNLEKELDLATREVMETDPVVAYAVEDIRLQQTEVGVRQMVSVEILYSRTQEEIQAIQSAWGESGIKNRVIGALERAEPAITLQVANYQPVNLDRFVRTYYEEHLETIMECPQVVVQVYPDQGSERVVEIQFRYSISQETLLQMRRDVQVLLNSAAGYVEGLTSEQVKANRLYAFLRPLFVQSRPSETPVYSLLCVGAGDSRSVAMVYGLLCRRARLLRLRRSLMPLLRHDLRQRRALQILLQKRDIILFRLRTVLCRLAVGIITQERDLLVIRLGALHIGLHRRTAALGLLPGDIAPAGSAAAAVAE